MMLLNVLSSLSKQIIRFAAVAVPIKISADYGVWSTNTAEGALLFSQLKSHVLPGTIVYKDELPSPNEAKQSMVVGWNKFVNCAFNFGGMATERIESECRKLNDQIDKLGANAGGE